MENEIKEQEASVSIGIIIRIIFGGVVAIIISPTVILIHMLLFLYFVLTMFVIMVIAVLGSPAIIFSSELKDILKTNLMEIYRKATIAYKNILREVTAQHVKSAFLWGKLESYERSKKHEAKYIDAVIKNAPYIGLGIMIIITVIIISIKLSN